MNYNKLIKQCINPESNSVEIVIGDRIPKKLENRTNRIVLIDQSELKNIIKYHSEGFRLSYDKWLVKIWFTESLTPSRLIAASYYHNCSVRSVSDDKEVSSSKTRVSFLLNAYHTLGDISLFSEAKAEYFGQKLKDSSTESNAMTSRECVSMFYGEVFKSLGLSHEEFKLRMTESNKHYLDSIIDATLDFFPQNSGIKTLYGSGFSSFDINSFIKYPLTFIGSGDRSSGRPLLVPEITLIKSGTGTGKTELAIRVMKAFHLNNKKIVVISNLLSVVSSIKKQFEDLLLESWEMKFLGGRYEILSTPSIATSSECLSEIESSRHIVTTLKSLSKLVIKNKLLDADLVIIDESEKVLETLYSLKEGYMDKSEKEKAKEILKSVLRSDAQVMMMDADMTDMITTDFVDKYKQDRIVVAGVIPPELVCKRVSKLNVEAQIDEWKKHEHYLLSHGLKPREKNFIACDSKASIEKWLVASGYFTIDNGTKNADYQAAINDKVMAIVASDGQNDDLLIEQKLFLSNPNLEIYKYDTIIVSPILKEGFSINVPHADVLTVFSTGILTPKEIIQFASRLRAAKKLVFALKKSSDYHSESYYRHAFSSEEKFGAKLNKYKSILRSNLRYSLYRTLVHSGFKVHDNNQILPVGDVDYLLESSGNISIDPDVRSIARGEKEALMHSQDMRKKTEAAEALKSILCLEHCEESDLRVHIRKTECEIGTSIEAMFTMLLNKSNIINEYLPRKARINNDSKGKTRKVYSIYNLLGYKTTRTNSGKMTKVKKIKT